MCTLLPQVWAEQERRKLGEVRAVAGRIERENSLLSALQKRVPYKEVLQAARIEFLRKELHRAKGRDADAANLARSMEAVRMEKNEQKELLERSLEALEGLSDRLAAEKRDAAELRGLNAAALAAELRDEMAPSKVTRLILSPAVLGLVVATSGGRPLGGRGPGGGNTSPPPSTYPHFARGPSLTHPPSVSTHSPPVRDGRHGVRAGSQGRVLRQGGEPARGAHARAAERGGLRGRGPHVERERARVAPPAAHRTDALK